MQKLSTPTTRLFPATTHLSGTGVTNSNAANTGGYSGFVAHLNVSAHVGATGTLDVKFQDSPDGTIWTDIGSGAMTQVTTANSATRLVVSNVAKKVRAVATLGGTSPDYTFSLDITGIN